MERGEIGVLERIRPLVEQIGVDQFGVCRFSDLPGLLPVRSRGRIPEDARSVLVLLFGYYIGEYPNRNLSRYAIVDDYHQVIRGKLELLVENLLNLFKTEQFIPFVDASPIPEVQAAHLAGLGDVGLNGQLLNPVYGSYCFIAEVVTTLALPSFAGSPPSLCTHCGACLAACPTGALSREGFCLQRCRSQITQKKGQLTDWEAGEIRRGGFAWGCDRCTDACPVNRKAQKSQVPEFYQGAQPVLCPEEVAELCRRKAYGWRGEAVLLRNLRLLTSERAEKDYK